MNPEVIIPALEFALKNKELAYELSIFSNCLITGKISPPLSTTLLSHVEIDKILILKPTPKFISKDYQLFFYALSYIKNSVVDFSESNVSQSINSFSDKQFHKSVAGHWYYITGYILLLLNRFFDQDIPKWIGENKTFKNSHHLYWDLLPYMNSAVNNLINALYASTSDIRAEGNYFSLNESVTKTARNNPDFARELLYSCQSDFRQMELFFPHAFHGLSASVGISKAFPVLRELLNSGKKDQQIIGLKTYGWMHGNNDRPEEVEKEVGPILESIELQFDDALTSQVIYVYGLLIDKLSNARQKLVSIPESYPGRDTRFALSQLVMLKIETERQQKWFQNALCIFYNLNGQHIGTYRNLSYAFAFNYSSNADLFYDYIDHFISEPNNQLRNIEAFREVFEKALKEDKGGFEDWLTRSLNNENNRFHRAVSFVLLAIDRQRAGEIQLSPRIMNNLHPYDIEFILLKVVGNVVAKEHLQSLTFSALEYNRATGLVEVLVKELFCVYIMYNYPATIEYLRAKTTTASALEKKVIEEIEQYYNDEHQIRTKKPLELSPSPKRMREYFNKYSKQLQNAINDSPFKEPSILDFVTKITLKVGNAFFHRDDSYNALKNKYNNRSEMGRVAVEFDMPGGEFTDPIGQEFNRHCWRTAKRRKP